MLCRGTKDVERCLAVLGDRAWFHRHGVLVQELIPPAGRDLRLIVAAQRIVGASRRDAARGEWRTNVALGGHPAHTTASPDACALALRTTDALGTDLVGVDLLPLRDGHHVVIEVNGAAEFDDADSFEGRNLYRDAAVALELLPASTMEPPRAAVGLPSSAEQE
jgi:glutathione synthase/RimK-type ligase-like ATP-grasp enzyme